MAKQHLCHGCVLLSLCVGLYGVLSLRPIPNLGIFSGVQGLMWSMALVHGLLFSVVHLGFAALLRRTPLRSAVFASDCLKCASAMVGVGFLLGGVTTDGKPGPGIAGVPAGMAVLLAGASAVSWEVGNRWRESRRGLPSR